MGKRPGTSDMDPRSSLEALCLYLIGWPMRDVCRAYNIDRTTPHKVAERHDLLRVRPRRKLDRFPIDLLDAYIAARVRE